MAGANNPVPFGSPEGSAHWTRAQTEAGGATIPLRALPAICDSDGFDIGLIWPKRKPRLLDLFCCAGGASMGYHQAGFEVVGVDIRPQPRYPFKFIQTDVLALDPAFVASFDAIHASPPCQAHSALKWMHNAKQHVDLVPATRAMLIASKRPYVIENVEGSPLINPTVLCGTGFGLGTGDAELWRHRLFETSFPPLLPPPCQHRQKPRVIGVYGGHGRDRRRTVNTQDYSTEQRREAMGIDWMTGAELSQAIPPAYTRWIGEHLFKSLQQSAAQLPDRADPSAPVSTFIHDSEVA